MNRPAYKFTGERYVPSVQGEIRIEHLQRYVAAIALAKERTVLDVACGEGYGTCMLAGVAAAAVGVDISKEVIADASLRYRDILNLKFSACSAVATGRTGASFDLVVSFETIEHLVEQDEMLAEIGRVLKPTGVLLISSPNRPVYSGSRSEPNEFHVKELDFIEFDALLSRHFRHVEYYGQRLSIGAVVQSLSRQEAFFQAFNDDGTDVTNSTGTLIDPMYFLAVCGNSDEVLPNIQPMIFVPDSIDLLNHYVGFAKWAQNQDRAIERKNEQIHHLQNEIKQLQTASKRFNVEILRADAQLSLLKDLLAFGEADEF